MKMNKNPKEIVKLLMAFFVAMQQGTIIALWTTHAKQRARMESRNARPVTRTTSASNRPIVLETHGRDRRWYLSFDKDGSPSIAINDSLYGAMFLTYNDGIWLIKSVIARSHYQRNYEAFDLESILGLIQQYNNPAAVQEAEVADNPVVEEVEEETPVMVQETMMGDPSVEEIREVEVTREEALLRLSKYSRKTLLQLRKHLEITGNGTGTRGAVSTENAIESILTFMDDRKNYDLDF